MSTIFIVELVIKVISRGFFIGEKTYLRDKWCQLDAIIVVFSILDILLTDAKTEFMRVMILFRSLD